LLLVVDIGNTNVVSGLYDGPRLLVHWRLATDPRRTADECAMSLVELFRHSGHEFGAVRHIAISSVVPPVTPTLVDVARRYFGCDPLIVGPETYTGMPVLYDNPQEVGADRIVNAVAAYEKHGGPLVIVDFGTATTFDAVTADGEYLGGAIAPGIGISVEALFQRAARLTRVQLRRPAAAIGRTTEASLQSGIVFGFAGQVDAMVRRIAAELGGRPLVIATGGLAPFVAEESVTIERIDPLLTLEGLRIIHERNQKGNGK
jgi:type III pantothenate kinase